MSEIDDLASKFASLVNRDLAAFRKEQAATVKKSVTEIPELKVVVNRSAATKMRTPQEQAMEIAEGQSWTCTGAHMTDNARHVFLQKQGKLVGTPSRNLAKEEFVAFKDAWNDAMRDCNLVNFARKAGYDERDA